MPHFDEWGGDEWMCQGPNHRGPRVQNSRVESQWRPDITGHKGAGNCCPACVAFYDSKRARKLEREREREPLNRLDFADDRAEYEVQRELGRIGVRNAPRPSRCPECKGALAEHGGMVGETTLACPYHGTVWEDAEDAVRRVY
jgi:hypothetical protein